jgi:N-carbamoylputrescine amidase
MKIAGIQFACTEDRAGNLEKASKVLDVALEQGAKIVCFQELFDLQWFPRNRDEAAFALAEELREGSYAAFRERAKAADAVVLLPVFEREGERCYNSCLVIDNGETAGVYRKIHVPDIPLWEEQFYFAKGDRGFPVFHTRHGAIGIQISWDNLYPEGSRILALKGADIIFAPTACAFKSQHIWQTVISANSMVNGLCIMRINRVGSEEAQDFYGMSFCVNPEGELIGGPTGSADSILLAEVDFEDMKHVRREWPLMKERRPQEYGEILEAYAG